MAYDPSSGRTVLFGGDGAGIVYDDTWTWDGTTWRQETPAVSPPARWSAAMAYDAARDVVVLFGGGDGQALGDTWIWDGSSWVEQHPPVSPPARPDAAMAYDEARGRVVLFGGCGDPDNGSDFNDTWMWDGSTWTQELPATSPPPSCLAAMAYDAPSARLLLTGGFGNFGDTWAWDGNTWASIPDSYHPNLPLLRPHLITRAVGEQTLLMDTGTCLAVSDVGDPICSVTDLAWTWSGSSWTKQPIVGPPARYASSVAASAGPATVVMFGGWKPDGGFTDETWTLIADSSPT